MNDLPPSRMIKRDNLLEMFVLYPLEALTKSLMRGDGWKANEIVLLERRCRAFLSALDARRQAENGE